MAALSFLSDALVARTTQAQRPAETIRKMPEHSAFLATLRQLEGGWGAAFSAGKMTAPVAALPSQSGPLGRIGSFVDQALSYDHNTGGATAGPRDIPVGPASAGLLDAAGLTPQTPMPTAGLKGLTMPGARANGTARALRTSSVAPQLSANTPSIGNTASVSVSSSPARDAVLGVAALSARLPIGAADTRGVSMAQVPLPVIRDAALGVAALSARLAIGAADTRGVGMAQVPRPVIRDGALGVAALSAKLAIGAADTRGVSMAQVPRPVMVVGATIPPQAIGQSAQTEAVDDEGLEGKSLPLARMAAVVKFQSSGPSVSVTEVQGGLAISVWSALDAQKMTPALRKSIEDEVARHGCRLARIHMDGYRFGRPASTGLTQE